MGLEQRDVLSEQLSKQNFNHFRNTFHPVKENLFDNITHDVKKKVNEGYTVEKFVSSVFVHPTMNVVSHQEEVEFRHQPSKMKIFRSGVTIFVSQAKKKTRSGNIFVIRCDFFSDVSVLKFNHSSRFLTMTMIKLLMKTTTALLKIIRIKTRRR